MINNITYYMFFINIPFQNYFDTNAKGDLIIEKMRQKQGLRYKIDKVFYEC